MREASATGALGVRNYLDGVLGKIRESARERTPGLPVGKAEAREALAKVIRENARQEGLRRRLAG